MSKENSSTINLHGILLLGLLFLTLKLCGVINWSWWWVTLPFWGGPAILLFMILCIGAVIAAALFIVWREGR